MSDHAIVIEAGVPARGYWRELWRFRGLLRILAWRDLVVRYRHAALGIAWALARPAMALAAFTIIFGHIAKLPSGGVPYPLLVLCGLLPWQLFAGATADAGPSVVANAALLSKVYFPRLLVPLAAGASALIDAAVCAVALAAMLCWYGQPVGWHALVGVPMAVIAALATAAGAGIWLAALSVRYPDARHLAPIVVQIGLYLAPIGYSSALVPERWRLAYALDPLVAPIELLRWSVAGGTAYWPSIAVSLAMGALLLTGSLAFFRRVERGFADTL